MTVILTPETEMRLLQEAERTGRDVNSLAETLITDGLNHSAFSGDPDHLTDEETAEIRAGIARGLEAAAAGRVTPLAQAVAEARQRHGFPASWANGADGSQ